MSATTLPVTVVFLMTLLVTRLSVIVDSVQVDVGSMILFVLVPDPITTFIEMSTAHFLKIVSN